MTQSRDNLTEVEKWENHRDPSKVDFSKITENDIPPDADHFELWVAFEAYKKRKTR